MVYKLLKAFYDLKPFFWLQYERFLTFFLEKLGLKQINIDYNIFVINTGLNKLVMNFFINNIKIIAFKNNKIIKQIKSKLAFTFSMVIIGANQLLFKPKNRMRSRKNDYQVVIICLY